MWSSLVHDTGRRNIHVKKTKYPVSFEIAGPVAIFTRPDSGSGFVSYPAQPFHPEGHVRLCQLFGGVLTSNQRELKFATPSGSNVMPRILPIVCDEFRPVIP